MKSKKITAIYLYATQVFTPEMMRFLLVLKDKLQQKGINVLGIVSPNDLFDFAFTSSAPSLSDVVLYTDDLSCATITELQSHFQSKIPGVVFSRFVNDSLGAQGIEHVNDIASQYKEQTLWISQTLMPMLVSKLGYSSAKGLILDFVLARYPLDERRQMIIINDLSSALQVKPRHQSRPNRKLYFPTHFLLAYNNSRSRQVDQRDGYISERARAARNNLHESLISTLRDYAESNRSKGRVSFFRRPIVSGKPDEPMQSLESIFSGIKFE